MEQVFNTVLGQSPAPRPRLKGPEPVPGVSASSGVRGQKRDDATSSTRSAESRNLDTASQSGSNKSAASAVSIEAGMKVRSEDELTVQELSKVRELKQRDQEVRSHEQAHISAGGGHVVGGARYTHTEGPDGRQYAIAGEVSIDTSKVAGDPEATIEKAKTIRRAALAPAQPSGQDQAVAAKAQTMETEARMEQVQQRRTDGMAAYGAANAVQQRGQNITTAV